MEHAGGDGSGDGDGDRRGANTGRGRGAWIQQTHRQEQLRRPRHPNNQQPNNQLPNNQQPTVSYGNRNSKLSPNAPEFVPRNLGQPEPQHQPQHQSHYHQRGGRQKHSVQGRVNQARNEPPQQPQQTQFINQMPYHTHSHNHGYQTQMMYQQVPNYDMSHYSMYNPHSQNPQHHNLKGPERNSVNNQPASLSNVKRQLENAMETLNSSPGEFDALVEPLVSSITPHLKVLGHAQEIVNAIIKQSISEGNFRYSGARLCAHLDAIESPADDTVSNFRTALYTRCREETEAETQSWPKDQNEQTCHGLMLCLAELVAQLDQPAAAILGKHLVHLISVTLKSPATYSAKFICQALKLAGQYLERDSTNREDIELVMRALTELVTEGRVDQCVGRMVNSVRELRSDNWGRVVPAHGPTPGEPAPAINEQQQIPQHSFDEPVYYGPDGLILSPEENTFCQSRATSDGITEEDNGENICDGFRKLPNNLSNMTLDYEEDEDMAIAEAYEQFLLMPPNQSTGHKVQRG